MIPEAVIGAEDYLIVKHTHDIELARELMTAELIREAVWPGDPYSVVVARRERIARRLQRPKQRWVRILPALRNSWAWHEGWSHSFHEHDEPSRGAFPAVVFYG